MIVWCACLSASESEVFYSVTVVFLQDIRNFQSEATSLHFIAPRFWVKRIFLQLIVV